jgi:hypothetical protein
MAKELVQKPFRAEPEIIELLDKMAAKEFKNRNAMLIQLILDGAEKRNIPIPKKKPRP